jgi:hypothetical protein
MPTRVIMIEFNPEVTSGQIEQFQQELKALADEVHYKTGFHCGTYKSFPKPAPSSRILLSTGSHISSQI